MEEPDDLRPVFDKTGKGWSSAERDRVRTWLNEDPQLGLIVRHTLLALRDSAGNRAQPEDAEDAWGDFYTPSAPGGDSDLDKVMKAYDPKRGKRFWRWLLFCFKRWSRRRADQRWGRRGGEQTVDAIVFDLMPEPDQPTEALASWKEFVNLLNGCLDELSGLQKSVFVLRNMQILPGAVVTDLWKTGKGSGPLLDSDIADQLGFEGDKATQETRVRVTYLRSKEAVGECLREKGWEP